MAFAVKVDGLGLIFTGRCSHRNGHNYSCYVFTRTVTQEMRTEACGYSGNLLHVDTQATLCSVNCRSLLLTAAVGHSSGLFITPVSAGFLRKSSSYAGIRDSL